MFLVINDINFASYADDNNKSDSGDSTNSVITSLQDSAKRLFQLFSDNQMQGNANKCDIITSTSKTHQTFVIHSSIESCCCEELLGVKTDS